MTTKSMDIVKWKRTVVATLVVVAMDAIWLSLPMNKRMYRDAVRAVQKSDMSIDWLAAAAVYPLVFLGFLLFLFGGDEGHYGAAWKGAAFGFIVYGIYNLTNKAVFTSYPWTAVLADTAWGTFLFCAATLLAFVLVPK